MHLTLLYVTALTSTNHHFTVLRHHVCTLCKINQHLGVNFGGIWRSELGFFFCFFWIFTLNKSGLFFKSPVATVLLMRKLSSFIMSMPANATWHVRHCGLEMEWYYSWKGRDGQKKKIGKANERKGKVKTGKDGQGGKRGASAPHGAFIEWTRA